MRLEECAERFQTRVIDISQETAQARSMGKTPASKQCHECCLEGSDAFKEVRQRPFSADRIAY